MKIELSKIPSEGIFIDSKIHIDKELYKNTEIIEIKELYANGVISYDYLNNLVIDLNLKGKFILNDSISLEKIDYPFSLKVEENIDYLSDSYKDFYEKSKNILDISEILWENIVLEIPTSATKVDTDNLSLSGDGWELVNNNQSKIDPRLAKLNELFMDGKE